MVSKNDQDNCQSMIVFRSNQDQPNKSTVSETMNVGPIVYQSDDQWERVSCCKWTFH